MSTRSFYSFENYQLKPGRKLLHVSSSWIGFVYLYIEAAPVYALQIGLITVAFLMLFDVIRLNKKFEQKIQNSFLKTMFIRRDINRLNSATWYMISVVALIVFFGGTDYHSRINVAFPIFFLAFGDTAASVIGKICNGTKLWFLDGSWQGITANMVVCFMISVFGFSLEYSVLLAFTAAVMEAVPVPVLDDNFVMSISTGVLIAVII